MTQENDRNSKIIAEVKRRFPHITPVLEQNNLREDDQAVLYLMMIELLAIGPDDEAAQDTLIEQIKGKYTWMETTTIQQKRSFAVIYSAIYECIKHLDERIAS